MPGMKDEHNKGWHGGKVVTGPGEISNSRDLLALFRLTD